MRDYPAIIERLLERFQNGEIRFDDSVACNFLANLRQLLESEKLTSTYPAVYFYSCWSLHTALDRNVVSQQVLSRIASNLPSTNEADPTFIDIVCENLRSEDLRSEILTLGTLFGFRDVVSHTPRWKDIYGVILNLVTDKPLSPPVNIPAGSSLRIAPGFSQLITISSTIRLWLHGNRGQQAEWTIAIVPDGQLFDVKNLSGLHTYNGGVFTMK